MPRYDLGAVSDFADSEPTKASTACRDLVVVRRGEAFFVLDHNCQHLGAPLSEGYVDGDTIVCPWHRSVMRLSDGSLVEPPGCKHLHSYEALVENGRLFVDVDPDEPQYRSVTFAEKASGDHPDSVLILGAGAAGMTAAMTLAEEGFRGRLTIISHEADITFDRTKLSKGLIEDRDEAAMGALMELRGEGLEFRNENVVSVDVHSREVKLANGETLSAERLIIATGGKPKVPDIPGTDLDGAIVLRSLEDAARLETLVSEGKRAVIVGAGFIGLEAAAFLSGEDMDVTVLAGDEVPFEKMLGTRIGKRLRKEQTEAGVAYRGDVHAKAIKGDGQVEAVELSNGESVAADLVILATGVEPRTDILSGVSPDEDGGLSVSPGLAVQDVEGVFAAGDISRLDTPFGKIRTEHWRWAQQLGRRAALSALGREKTPGIVPFFWTKQQADSSYVYVGHAESYDDVLFEGDPDEGDFIAFYLDRSRIVAIFAYGMTDRVSRIEREMARRGPLSRKDLGI